MSKVRPAISAVHEVPAKGLIEDIVLVEVVVDGGYAVVDNGVAIQAVVAAADVAKIIIIIPIIELEP